MEKEIMSHIRGLDDDKKPIHKLYIPGYPLELFTVRPEVTGNKVQSTQNVTMLVEELKSLDVNGLNFPLAVAATAEASKHVTDFDEVRTNLVLLCLQKEDTELWRASFRKTLKDAQLEHTCLGFQCFNPANIEKLKGHFRRGNLFVLPLKPESPLFGTEALSAVAAGVPILVSRYSGIASLLSKMVADEPVVITMRSESEIQTWKGRIIQKILNPEEAQSQANRLRELLLLDTSIASTHLDFINTIADESCTKLKVELDISSVDVQKHNEVAATFDVKLGDSGDPMNTKKYIIAVFQKLLHHREKLDMGLLIEHIKSEVTKMWQEVLSSLEATNRKLVNIQSGSLVFTLFSPTQNSIRQLQNEAWKTAFQKKFVEFIKLIGINADVQISELEGLEINQLELLREMHKLKLMETDEYSIGYETMTTDSDKGSVILPRDDKVKEWLSKQEELSTSDKKDEVLKLQETWHLDHIENTDEICAGNRFSVSESGVIGISCKEQPGLSVIYQGTHKPPLILTNVSHRFATFIKSADREFLATLGLDENLYLWDINKGTSTKKFDPKMHEGKFTGYPKIFVIDDKTMGYAAEPSNKRCRVFFINTEDTQGQWPSSTLTLSTNVRLIPDMCYIKMLDGTPCLLLCSFSDRCVQAVELMGGKIRWQTGKLQMGEYCRLASICTDENNTVHVTDRHRMHILSGEDGSVIRSINLMPFGVEYAVCVRVHDEYLYVMYLGFNKRYAMNKFSIELDE